MISTNLITTTTTTNNNHINSISVQGALRRGPGQLRHLRALQRDPRLPPSVWRVVVIVKVIVIIINGNSYNDIVVVVVVVVVVMIIITIIVTFSLARPA